MVSRRNFIAGAVGAAGLVLLDPVGLAGARAQAASLPAGELFPLGVASGDPTSSGVVLWTRLVSPEAGTALPDADLPVDWEVAADPSFASVLASGTAPAVATLAHSVHVEVDGLASDTRYFYRFSVDGRMSPVGRTATFPGNGVTPGEVRFVLASCQNWADGYYNAWAAAVADDVDFVVFVGDYIYESSANRPPRPISLPLSKDVPTYRARYALYRSDENLRAAHAAYPWIITMDDHEVANNVLGDLGQDGGAQTPEAQAAFLQRRADAFQVWYEHLPVRLPPPSGSSYRIHRRVDHSDLLRFFVLDGRQYRSAYPVPGESIGGETPVRHDEGRTMLGPDQEAWLTAQFAGTGAVWNVLAQQTVFTAMPITLGTSTFYNYDQWDGYTANRLRILQALMDHDVSNPMVLSGDIHLAAAAGVLADPEDPDSVNVANEVVCTSISSRFDPELLDIVQTALDSIPWARYGNANERGYSLITVTPEAWTTEFRTVDVSVPDASASTDYTDVVLATVREPGPGPDPDPDPTTPSTSTTSPTSSTSPSPSPSPSPDPSTPSTSTQPSTTSPSAPSSTMPPVASPARPIRRTPKFTG